MSKIPETAPCWVVRNAHGQPWDDVSDAHFPTREAAGRLIHSTVQLPDCCYTVRCDECGEEPESDEYGHLHFNSGSEFVPVNWDWTEVGGLHFCEECSPRAVCRGCRGLSGAGAGGRDWLCQDCHEKTGVTA